MSKVRDVFARLSFPYSRLQPFFESLTSDGSTSTRLLCFEHESDEKVSRTHVHFILLGGCRTIQTYKNLITSSIGSPVKSTDWSFKTVDPLLQDDCIKYMSKGRLDPVINKGFDEEYVKMMKKDGYDKKDEKKKPTKDGDDKKNDWYYVSKALAILYKKYYPQKTIPIMWNEESCYDVSFTLEQAMESLRSMIRQERKVIGKKKFMDYLFFMMVGINKSYDASIVWNNIPTEFNRQVNY